MKVEFYAGLLIPFLGTTGGAPHLLIGQLCDRSASQYGVNKDTTGQNGLWCFCLLRLNRVPDHGFQLIRCSLSCVAQINLMVEPRICNVKSKSLFRHKLMHELHRRRFIVVWADVHALNTEPLIAGQKLHL